MQVSTALNMKPEYLAATGRLARQTLACCSRPGSEGCVNRQTGPLQPPGAEDAHPPPVGATCSKGEAVAVRGRHGATTVTAGDPDGKGESNDPPPPLGTQPNSPSAIKSYFIRRISASHGRSASLNEFAHQRAAATNTWNGFHKRFAGTGGRGCDRPFVRLFFGDSSPGSRGVSSHLDLTGRWAFAAICFSNC